MSNAIKSLLACLPLLAACNVQLPAVDDASGNQNQTARVVAPVILQPTLPVTGCTDGTDCPRDLYTAESIFEDSTTFTGDTALDANRQDSWFTWQLNSKTFHAGVYTYNLGVVTDAYLDSTSGRIYMKLSDGSTVMSPWLWDNGPHTTITVLTWSVANQHSYYAGPSLPAFGWSDAHTAYLRLCGNGSASSCANISKHVN